MIEILGDLVRTLVLIALVSLILDMLVPGDEYRRYVRMVIGFIILLVIINAVTEFTRRGQVDIFAIADIPVTTKEQNFLEEEGQNLREHTRQQVIQKYNRMVRDYLAGQIKQMGEWELTEIKIEFAKNLTETGRDPSETYLYAEFGDISMVKAFLTSNETAKPEDTAAGTDITIDITGVPPVQIGDPPDEPESDHNGDTTDSLYENGDYNREKTLIKEHIAGRLQIAPEKIEVIFTEK